MNDTIDAVDQFGVEAVRYEQWAHSEEPNAGLAAREALIRISSLYVAALQLPPPFTDELEGQPKVERIPTDDYAKVKAYRGLPIDMYSEIFDPLPVPPEEPVIGSIGDDVIDIYGEVLTGLRAYQAGNKAGALWEWGFGFRHHWGEHATGAIRALHAWLASNECDRLSNVP
jgi:hypothetical protein